MKIQKKFKTFSIKKFFLTVLFTVIVSVFIGSTILFVGSVPQWIRAEIMFGIEPGSEFLVELASNDNLYEKFEETSNQEKSLYGEDYPAEELLLCRLIDLLSTNRIMQVYTLSLLIGISLGTIIYIVAIQNIKFKQIVLELFVAFLILYIFVALLNLGYETIINQLIQNITSQEITYYTYLYDFQWYTALVPYIFAAIIIYVTNMVKQKIITAKFNKQLHKKEILN